jgi:hypothetical protein
VADYTTTGLIADVKRRGHFPTSQSTFQTSDLLKILNDALYAVIVPLIQSAQEEFFVTYSDTTIVAGTDAYAIPSRAIGGALRDVATVDGAELTSLERLDPEVITHDDRPEGFMLRGNKVVLYPSPVQSGTLRLSYYRRPSELVATSSCGLITAINTGTNEVTVSSTPSGWTTNTSIDIIPSTPHFDALSEAVAISSVAGTTITLPSLPSGLAVGDYLTPAGQSPIPQVPVEAHPLLAQAAALRCASDQGTDDAFKRLADVYSRMERDFLQILSPRVEGAPKKVNNRGGIFSYV